MTKLVLMQFREQLRKHTERLCISLWLASQKGEDCGLLMVVVTRPSQRADNGRRRMTSAPHCQLFDRCGDASRSFAIPQLSSRHLYGP